MHHLIKNHHPIRHIKSFKHALDGILHAILNEANFRIQVLISGVSIGLGLHYKIQNTEWAILVICIGMLLSAEIINTVVEELIDFFLKEDHRTAKIIKDLSAGFVLVTALTTLFILYLIFWHRVFIN